MGNKLCTIYVVRHMESGANVLASQKIIFDPSLELTTSLSATGKGQAMALATKFKDIDFAAVISSNFTRAKETASVLKGERNLALLTAEAIGERDYGRWSGKWHTVKDKLQEEIRELSEEEKMRFVFDDVETEEHVVVRFITYLREIAVAYAGKTILIVSHGNTMRAFLVKIGFAKYHQLSHGTIDNGGYFVVESDGVNFFLKSTSGVHKTE